MLDLHIRLSCTYRVKLQNYKFDSALLPSWFGGFQQLYQTDIFDISNTFKTLTAAKTCFVSQARVSIARCWGQQTFRLEIFKRYYTVMVNVYDGHKRTIHLTLNHYLSKGQTGHYQCQQLHILMMTDPAQILSAMVL